MVAIDNVLPAQAPQAPIQPPRAPSPPDFLNRHTSYILPDGVAAVFAALRGFENPNRVNRVVIGNVRPFKLKFVLHFDDMEVDVVVRQYQLANGQQIVEFQRASDGTVEFNTFLHQYLLERLRNNGITRLDGSALIEIHYPRFDL